jgi:serine/threonine protein phosphatase PrpC
MTENGGLSSFDGAKMESVYTNAFVKANKAMHKANFDDSLSGTTGITVFIKGGMLYVANVGDSRAIIARKNGEGKLRSHPLSIDQTPFRKDERERLKKQGARIMTLDQIEGQEEIHENWGTELGEEIDEVGDPPRVWDHTLERPGCAFTRSLGDNVAELCGVYAEPEILVWKLMPEDTFVVIASDGVFEFLTSQSVVDAISKFEDPLEAAKHVVAEAYRLWLTYDDRTDDITIIILTFEGMVVHENKSTKVEYHSTKMSALANVENKPVRQTMSKAKRKVISESWGDDKGAEEFDFAAHATPKVMDDSTLISIL